MSAEADVSIVKSVILQGNTHSSASGNQGVAVLDYVMSFLVLFFRLTKNYFSLVISWFDEELFSLLISSVIE